MKHGGDLTEAIAQYGGSPDMWLDLSTGINPWPWPIPSLPNEIWQRLPSTADGAALIVAAREAYRVPDEVEIVIAPGTQALIQWLPRLAASGAVAIAGPTYSEHARAWSHCGHGIMALDTARPFPDGARHSVIVNPNNPDGRTIDLDSLEQIAAIARDRGGWLVIDEAFADLDPRISAAALCRDRPVVILRSFGKFYGLAGLRLGFAIASPSIADAIQTALGPWPCSGPALAVGRAALSDETWAAHMRETLPDHARRLDEVLLARGFAMAGGTALFRLVRHADAAVIHESLAQQQIWCRSFEWSTDLLRFGLPRDDAALARLATALKPACE
ncbi:MAG TPA: threonine-phosphate decarboxylase CobD [Nitrobacter sp.]|nr:threonine-phosphate decarboxylase CobD [Nitrobacter sp.]